MAVLVHNQAADWTQELYQTLFDQVIPDRSNPPAGMLLHAAMPGEEGGWQVIDVWESEADFWHFAEEKILPAARKLGAPPFQTKVTEIYNHLIP